MAAKKEIFQGWKKHLAQWQLTPDALALSLRVTQECSKVLLHWDENLSDRSPVSKQRNHVTIYGYRDVSIAENCELVVDGLVNEQTHLYIENLNMLPGSALRLQTDSWVFINTLTIAGVKALPENHECSATIILKPVKGKNGSQGIDGVDGVSATDVACFGSNGGCATSGCDGEDGIGSRRAFIRIGLLNGNLDCIASASDGGDGGDGGNGGVGGRGLEALAGSGGNGGHGGHGGHASSGGELFVTIDALSHNSKVRGKTPIPQGGKGGMFGLGGSIGLGKPNGQPGLQGALGSTGMNGEPACIYLRYPDTQLSKQGVKVNA